MATFKIGKVLMKSLFKKPATKMYPVIPNEFQERTRGQVTIEKESCILCGICARKCHCRRQSRRHMDHRKNEMCAVRLLRGRMS